MLIGVQGTGTAIINGGQVVVGASVVLGSSVAGHGGTLVVNNGTLTANTNINVGGNAPGELTITGGIVRSPTVIVATNALASGAINLNGGVLETGQLRGGAGSSSAVTFNGGTLRATASNTAFIQQLSSLVIGSAGGTIDSAGFNIGLNNSMTGSGSANFFKEGAGTLTINAVSGGYIGGVTVRAGTLALAQVNALSNASSMTLANTSILDTLGTAQTINSLSGDVGTLVTTGNGALTLNNNASEDTVFSGVIFSTGVVNKTGAGTLVLANSSQVGALNHNACTLAIGTNNTVTVAGAATINGATTVLRVAASGQPAIIADSLTLTGTPTIDISGYDPAPNMPGSAFHTLVRTTSGVVGAFNVSVSGTPLGALVNLDTYLIGSAFIDSTGKNIITQTELVWNNMSASAAHGTFNIPDGHTFTIGAALSDKTGLSLGFGWDGTALDKKGEGTLVLNGQNTYTGKTDIHAGRLVVGGNATFNTAAITGDINVLSGGTLGGHGTVLGTVHIENGGIIAPGSSTGTLTVGNIVFHAGSFYEFEAREDGSADQIIANGHATINGGTVRVLASGNIWKTTERYTILTTSAGAIGTFAGLTTNLAFLNPILVYDANNVYLTFARNDTSFHNVGETHNQKETGRGIESLGAGNVIYNTVLSMDSDTARNSFDNMSGEIHASLKSAILVNSRYSRSAINQHLINLGWNRFPEPDKYLWGHAWGHSGHIRNDGNAARLSHDGGGFLTGFDRPVAIGTNTVLGLAVGYEHIRSEINERRNSRADIDIWHVLGYGSTRIGPVDLRAGAGFAWLDIDSKRNVNVPGLQSVNEAGYHGSLTQLFMEGSHTFNVTQTLSVTPYAGIAWSRVETLGFSETGNSTALQGRRNDISLTTTSLGVWSLWSLDSENRYRLYSDLGWQHNAGARDPESWLAFTGSNRFNIRGTTIQKNSLIAGVGGSILIGKNASLAVGYEGEFSSGSRDHSFRMKLDWQF